MEKVIAVFDIGKTNKKFLLFGEDYSVLKEEEIDFPEILDEDGFPCDDIEKIERWIIDKIHNAVKDNSFEIKGINFSTYGASFAYLDEKGKRIGPVYNYLKPLEPWIGEKFAAEYNKDGDFFRNTASPDLGMLNSGIQIYRLKQSRPEIFNRVKSILHFPQYVSYLLTGKIVSELTSIGCHTALWNYDKFRYHNWLENEGIKLPVPIGNNTSYMSNASGKQFPVGIGIHDSSASLVPYLKTGEEFILISSGTWCINMNPFNKDVLTKEELDKDCLCYLSAQQNQVKSSRLFMGHIHDMNAKRIEEYFNKPNGAFKKAACNKEKLARWLNDGNKIFFNQPVNSEEAGMNTDLSVFSSFDEAYNRMMFELTLLEIESIKLIIPRDDNSMNIFISGGFAYNEIFTGIISTIYKNKKVYISEIKNSSALGAAMIMNIFEHPVNLNLQQVAPLDL